MGKLFHLLLGVSRTGTDQGKGTLREGIPPPLPSRLSRCIRSLPGPLPGKSQGNPGPTEQSEGTERLPLALPGREEGGAAKAAFPITQRVREQIGLVPFPVILEMLLPADDGDDGVAELGAQGQLVGMGSVGTDRQTLEGEVPQHLFHCIQDIPFPRVLGLCGQDLVVEWCIL